MRPDVIALRNFYADGLGSAVADRVAACIHRFWPRLTGEHIAGLGYAPPLLERLGEEPASRVALMPAAQGVMAWPDPTRNAAALVEEEALPVPDGAYDRVILFHALEVAEQTRPLLREVWRILAPNGRVVVVVPRRRGFWAGLERTPFGSGEPFTRPQLKRVLGEHLLPVTAVSGALYLPPMRRLVRAPALRLADRVGRAVLPGLGGLVLVESEKQIYKMTPMPATPLARALRPAAVPKGARPVRPTAQGRVRRRVPRESA